MSTDSPEFGEFFNGIEYAQWGRGSKTLMVFSGGPGNNIPRGFAFNLLASGFDPFEDEFTVVLVTRKKGQPEGYSTRDMSADYAALIRREFDGHVELIIGMSYGGLIAQHFAADYPELFDHIVIAISAHRISEIGKSIDLRYAELLSQGKLRAANAAIVDALYPSGVKRPVFKAAGWILGSRLVGPRHSTYESDVMVEVRAELQHEAVESLRQIRVPVLIVCGTEDVYFPQEYVEEMAALIDTSTVKLYSGKGHLEALEDQSFSKDVFEFTAARVN